MKEIKECAFCGISKEFCQENNTDWENFGTDFKFNDVIGKWVIYCNNCGVYVVLDKGKKVSIEMWNLRDKLT